MKSRVTTISGVRAAHWTSTRFGTGVTVFLFRKGALASYQVVGHSACTRQLTAMSPGHISGRIHAICFSGGSGFGLSAADGVMRYLRGKRVGFSDGHNVIPIVVAASLHDGTRRPPSSRSGWQAAAKASSSPLREGRIGAGAGARIDQNRFPGGFGGSAGKYGSFTIAAYAAVNALGAIRDPNDGKWLPTAPLPLRRKMLEGDWNRSTILSAILTDAPLLQSQLAVVAQMATAAIARTVWPAFTPFDGDVVFAVSTSGRRESMSSLDTTIIGNTAAACLATAILRAVRAANRHSH